MVAPVPLPAVVRAGRGPRRHLGADRPGDHRRPDDLDLSDPDDHPDDLLADRRSAPASPGAWRAPCSALARGRSILTARSYSMSRVSRFCCSRSAAVALAGRGLRRRRWRRAPPRAGGRAARAAAAPAAGPGGGAAGEAPPAVPVEVATVERRDISSFIETNGTLEAENEVDIVARISAPIVELRAEEGMAVAPGPAAGPARRGRARRAARDLAGRPGRGDAGLRARPAARGQPADQPRGATSRRARASRPPRRSSRATRSSSATPRSGRRSPA